MTDSTVCATKACFSRSRYTGKEHDTESGNDFFEARYYTSAAGRFMSPDWSAKVEPVPYATMGDPQSLNLYAYVRNNPITGFDPDGHMGNADFSQMMMLAMGAQSAAFMGQRAEQAARAQQQSSLGSSPAPPPAVFQNQTDAAMNAAAGISGAVQSTGWEWGAALYKNSDGMVGITPLRTDHDPGSVGVSDYYTGKDIPAGATRIGDVHGHTGINSPDKGMHMSPGDLGNAGTMLKVHGAQTTYMVNPAGQVWKFNPATDAKPVLLPGRIQ
jgi:RHS repeat-associated protein